VVPFEEQAAKESPEAIFGCLRGFLAAPEELDGLGEPFIPTEEWDHLRDDWSPFPPE
jgi:hypothetical protein